MNTHDILSAIVGAEREAARLMLQAHGILAERKSGRRDVVTEYDRRVQALLTERLSAAVLGARFFCEENDRHDELGAEHLFLIDPIDGTMNFVRGLNHSCLSVAYWSRGERLVGAVFNPYADELFTAVRGEGAYCNGRRLSADGAALRDTIVVCGTAPYESGASEKTFRLMQRAYDASLDIRRQGSAALDLCSVAAGRAGAYFELALSLWDYAAGAILVEEAGGICTRLDGTPLPYDASRPTILAGGRAAYEELRRLAAET